MKKLTTLLLAAGLVVSSFAGASSASAVEVKPFGQFVTEFVGYSGNPNGAQGNGLSYDYNLDAAYRFRLGLDMVASENVSATALLQFGAYNFGDNEPGVTGSADVKFRWLYLDWVVPNTDVQVRMGRHVFTLPSYAFESAIVNDFADGVTVAADINENLAVSAMWIRSDINADYSGNIANGVAIPGTNAASNDRGIINDAFAVAASYQGEGYAIAPFAVYQMAGKNSSYNADDFGGYNTTYDMSAWYIGAAFELSMFDPFTFALDAHYKSVDLDNVPTGQDDSEGFYYVAAKAAYATDYGVPAVKGWYASGVDLNKADEKNLVGLGAGIEANSCATSILFGDNYIGNKTNLLSSDPQGKMGIMFEWADISFIENVTHVARVMYIEGTNKGDVAANDIQWNVMTEDDSAVEVNFNTKYQMYEDFSVLLDLGWVAPDFEHSNDDGFNEDIYRAALMFIYSF